MLVILLLLAQLTAQSGETYIAQSKWPDAAAVFEELTRANPNDGPSWAALGLTYFNLGRVDDASKAYEKALALAGGASRRSACSGPEYRQFDFWLGEWDVFNPAGQKIGHNSITSTNDGCVIFEDWRDARGGSGNSFNFYEPTTKRWHQFWVSSNGNATPLSVAADGTPMPMSGGLVDGAMRLQSASGVKPLNRWTWSKAEGGKVRQHAEQSNDDGKTWTTVFDGFYERAK